MKFLSWLFNMSVRHHNDAIRYERGKATSKIFIIILMLLFVGLTLGVEYWALTTMQSGGSDFLLGVMEFVLAIIIGLATVETCIAYSYFGFKYAAIGTLDKFINKYEQKRKNKQSDVLTVQNVSESPERKNKPWLDFFVGVMCAIFAVGTIVAMIWLYCLVILQNY